MIFPARIFSPVLAAALLWLGCARLSAQTNLAVAADGSAQFKTVQEAIMSVPAGTAANLW